MSYEWQGRQYVVIAAGGHGQAGTATSDAVVAFALPAPGEAKRSLWDRHVDQPGRRFLLGAVGAVIGLVLLAAAGRRLRRRGR
jgi:quinoprotein glucose dehydrogenase